MMVSINGGTPKSSILVGFSIINRPFGGTPMIMETPILWQQHTGGGPPATAPWPWSALALFVLQAHQIAPCSSGQDSSGKESLRKEKAPASAHV